MGKITKTAKALKRATTKIKQNLKEDSKDMLPLSHKKQPMNLPNRTVKAAKTTAKVAGAAGATAAAMTAYEGGGARMRRARQTIKDIKKDLSKK